jgi:ribulose 1,5-bisphosphate carboxylase large subunit-like protein
MDRVRKAEQQTGKKKIYFANVGGDIDKIDEMFNIAMAQGVSGIMFSPLINGFDIIKKYKGKVPIIAHNNLTHGMTRHPLLGISFSLWVKIQRLLGADMMISPAPDRSFYVMSPETNKHNIAVAVEENGLKKTLIGLSGSQTPATLYRHVRYMQHDDFAICPGGAVYEHPGGIEAGAQSFVQAVTALSDDSSLEGAATQHDALRVSLEVFAENKDNFDR